MTGNVTSLFGATDFSKQDHIVVAISGGSDSVALLMLLQDHLRQEHCSTQILAVTVDHGLRAGSAAEAEQVADLCANLGIPHRTVCWLRPNPVASGVASAARLARYQLLADVAKEIGAGMIVTGHTLDDQIETWAMRHERGGDRGLSGMAPITAFANSVWIFRPLLGVRRQFLRNLLKQKNINWIEDPTNSDRRSERVRMRQQLARDATGGHAMIEKFRAAQRNRIASQRAGAALVRRHFRQAAPGLFAIDPDFLVQGDRDAGLTALRALLAVVGGRGHFPDAGRSIALMEKLRGSKVRTGFSGCVAERAGGLLYLWREFRGQGPRPIAAEAGAVWDRRWRLVSGRVKGNSFIGPAGKAQPTGPDRVPASVPQRIVTAAASVLPVVYSDNDPAEVQAHAEVFSPVLAPWLHFLPSFDLDLAVSLDQLIGGPGVVSLPAGYKNTADP